MAKGMTVFNGALLEHGEREHVRRLLQLMDPPAGAAVLDAGCGIGAVASMMAAERPDLQFVLVNNNEYQAEICKTAGMDVHVADFNQMPISDGSIDVVMFNFALCHSADWFATMREAWRVLKPAGVLFIYDFARVSGDNLVMWHRLGAAAHGSPAVCDSAALAGFKLHQALIHKPAVDRLRDVLGAEAFDVVVGDVLPATWRFVREERDEDHVRWAMTRHKRIGFQFSGGRDSTAALYLLRPYWRQMTIYHLDTGDQFPATRAVVDRVEADLTSDGVTLHRIASDVAAVRKQFGLPSDLVPVDNHAYVGRHVSGRDLQLQSRYECCTRALMHPMHQRMIADGVTLIVRGQRDDEYDRPPYRSGDIGEGFEFLYPIQNWKGEQVTAYLREHGLPLADYYDNGARRAPECMGCTAWWDEGRAAYMRNKYPEKHAVLVRSLAGIRAEIDRQYRFLTGEMQ